MPATSIEHAWWLGIEEQFYLLWPLALILLMRRGTTFAAWVTGSVVLAVAGWRSFLYLGLGVPHAYVYNAFDTRLDQLAIGCLLALSVAQPGVTRILPRLAPNGFWPCVTFALLLVSRRGISADYHYSAGFTVNALLIAVLLVQLLQLHDRWPWRWLDHPVARYVGRISYPLYLWHQWGWAVTRHLHGPEVVQWLAGLATCVVLASGSYYIVEKPFLRLKDRLGAAPLRRTGARPALAASGVSPPILP
jgi:peptidoglycan/LPS O-acetylase OafA/YrhL